MVRTNSKEGEKDVAQQVTRPPVWEAAKKSEDSLREALRIMVDAEDADMEDLSEAACVSKNDMLAFLRTGNVLSNLHFRCVARLAYVLGYKITVTFEKTGENLCAD